MDTLTAPRLIYPVLQASRANLTQANSPSHSLARAAVELLGNEESVPPHSVIGSLRADSSAAAQLTSRSSAASWPVLLTPAGIHQAPGRLPLGPWHLDSELVIGLQ